MVSTFLFLALVNKSKKGPKNLLTQADRNAKLFDIIQNQIGSEKNTLFWSQNQNLLLNNDFKRLRLGSKFGTGKMKLLTSYTSFWKQKRLWPYKLSKSRYCQMNLQPL